MESSRRSLVARHRGASLSALAVSVFALAACSSEASGRPPINVANTDVDATIDAGSSGSVIAGGDLDVPSSSTDRPLTDVRVDAPRDVTADVVRDVTIDVARDVISDVARDATVDVTRDVTVDTGPVEVCGNSTDDDGDGAIDEDCPVTQCSMTVDPRTQVWFVNGTAPPALTSAAAGLGIAVHSGGAPLASLPPTAIVVVTISSPRDEAWNTALRTWVEGGGALMTLMIGFGDGSPEECDGSNAILARYGVSYDCVSTAPWGPVDEFFPHPITEGLTAAQVPFVNGRGVIALPGVAAAPLARIGDQIVGYATSVGCGRVIVWGDEHVGSSSYGATPRPFWERSLSWLASPR